MPVTAAEALEAAGVSVALCAAEAEELGVASVGAGAAEAAAVSVGEALGAAAAWIVTVAASPPRRGSCLLSDPVSTVRVTVCPGLNPSCQGMVPATLPFASASTRR